MQRMHAFVPGASRFLSTPALTLPRPCSAPAPDYYFLQPADDSSDQAQAAAAPSMTPHVGFLNFSNPLYGASASCSMQS